MKTVLMFLGWFLLTGAAGSVFPDAIARGISAIGLIGIGYLKSGETDNVWPAITFIIGWLTLGSALPRSFLGWYIGFILLCLIYFLYKGNKSSVKAQNAIHGIPENAVSNLINSGRYPQLEWYGSTFWLVNEKGESVTPHYSLKLPKELDSERNRSQIQIKKASLYTSRPQTYSSKNVEQRFVGEELEVRGTVNVRKSGYLGSDLSFSCYIKIHDDVSKNRLSWSWETY